MSNINENEFTPDLFNLTDEDGKEHVFEFLDSIEIDGTKYYALTPHFENPEELLESDGELVILKDDPNNDENDPENLALVSIDNEEEFEKVGQILLNRVNAMFEEEDEPEED
jgi:uncharacterized protein YrzB (UPF0473 family)